MTFREQACRFQGTEGLLATDDLKVRRPMRRSRWKRPCWVRASPVPADRIGDRDPKALGAPLLEWHVKSTTKAMQGLYAYDAFAPARQPARHARVAGYPQHIKRGKCGRFVSTMRPVLLIDEIDKADIGVSQRPVAGLDRSGIALSTRRARP